MITRNRLRSVNGTAKLVRIGVYGSKSQSNLPTELSVCSPAHMDSAAESGTVGAIRKTEQAKKDKDQNLNNSLRNIGAIISPPPWNLEAPESGNSFGTVCQNG